MRRLQDLTDDSVVTHLSCSSPRVDGFVDRIRDRLNIPSNAQHPLLV